MHDVLAMLLCKDVLRFLQVLRGRRAIYQRNLIQGRQDDKVQE